ncbi:MAG TPA: 16S rRNA (guanine(527)-N(7))-methyltransferase RsmG [Anaerolineaceae bacterium]|nr:16S rRNA (guanine(527)-N(7))-methyltransferase RsmG [Anaerolineaceae bacterium]
MQKLAEDLRQLTGLHMTARQQEQFALYARELVDWSTRMNLTTILDEDGIRIKHFLDSLSCLLVMDQAMPGRVVDVGSGAGFPGIPLKIMLPEMRLTIIESVQKKTIFCRHLVEALGLEGVEVEALRVEDAGRMPKHRQQYDWALARALGPMPVVAEYLLPLVRVGGTMLTQRGLNGAQEAEDARRAMLIFGGKLREARKVSLPGLEERYLLVVEKVKPTPPDYPRRAGIAVKKPLIKH